jgi:hypothetical protein
MLAWMATDERCTDLARQGAEADAMKERGLRSS